MNINKKNKKLLKSIKCNDIYKFCSEHNYEISELFNYIKININEISNCITKYAYFYKTTHFIKNLINIFHNCEIFVKSGDIAFKILYDILKYFKTKKSSYYNILKCYISFELNIYLDLHNFKHIPFLFFTINKTSLTQNFLSNKMPSPSSSINYFAGITCKYFIQNATYYKLINKFTINDIIEFHNIKLINNRCIYPIQQIFKATIFYLNITNKKNNLLAYFNHLLVILNIFKNYNYFKYIVVLIENSDYFITYDICHIALLFINDNMFYTKLSNMNYLFLQKITGKSKKNSLEHSLFKKMTELNILNTTEYISICNNC